MFCTGYTYYTINKFNKKSVVLEAYTDYENTFTAKWSYQRSNPRERTEGTEIIKIELSNYEDKKQCQKRKGNPNYLFWKQ